MTRAANRPRSCFLLLSPLERTLGPEFVEELTTLPEGTP